MIERWKNDERLFDVWYAKCGSKDVEGCRARVAVLPKRLVMLIRKRNEAH